MIPAIEAIKAINKERNNAIVVGTMTPNRYWGSVSDNKRFDLPIYGAMGKASSVGLGLALAQPDKKIVVLDGDGGLLMNLGSLVTIADQQPENYIHFVFEDGIYFTTGGQPVPGSGQFSLAGMSKNAGFRNAYEFEALEDFVSELPGIMRETGPVFVCLKVDHPGQESKVFIGSTGDGMRSLATELSHE